MGYIKMRSSTVSVLFGCRSVKRIYHATYNALVLFDSLKGTVRPDWICMRVVPLESPLKGHQPLYVFDFLISVLNI